MSDSKWVLVSEALPERGRLVLCQGERGGMFLGTFYAPYNGESKQHALVPNARTGRYVVAWQQLPEPAVLA